MEKQIRKSRIEEKITQEALKIAHSKLELKVADRTGELTEANKQLIKEILERKEAERIIRVRSAVLKIMGKASSRKNYLDILLKYIKGLSKCRYAGIRVLNEVGEIPYESYIGFSRDFWEKENWLSVVYDQCACIRVARGKPIAPDMPCMTAGGSFRCEDTLGFVSSLSEAEKKLYRGVCMQKGFNSVAVVPICYNNRIVAIIHLADERKNMVPLPLIEFIEQLTPLIGEGVHKFDIEERIRQSYTSHSLVNALLRYSFQEQDMQKILCRALELLLSIRWLAVESKASIHIVEEETDILILKAHINLPEPLLTKCSRIAFGKCLCGKTAKERRIYFASGIDKNHEITYEGMLPHGHYCIPIMLGEKALGVINLYLPEKYRRDLGKEEFLITFANALAVIIQRKVAEDELKKSNASLAAAQRIAHLGNWDWDIVKNTLHWSDEIYRIFGLTVQEFAATYDAFLNSVHPEDREFVKGSVNDTLSRKIKYSIDHRIVRPDGEIRIVHEQAEVIFDDSGKAIRMIGTVQDITEKKLGEERLREAQEQLEQARRLSDIGTLAATVAHELRNPLGVIRTASYNIKRKRLNPGIDKHIANIEKKIAESDQIIDNLLFYSRLKVPRLEKTDIFALLEECISHIRSKFKTSGAKIIKKYKGIKNNFINADPLQLKELFNNILNNAFEALPENSGSVEVKAVIDKINNNLVVSIKDNGVGIDSEDLKRLSEPFFTTKSKGTGLGLTVSYQVVNLHGGKIEAESLKGQGATFKVFLPYRA